MIRAHNRSQTRARRLLYALLESSHTLVLSNEIIAEVIKVLRYPHFRNLYGLTEADLLEYAQYLQSIADLVILDPQYLVPVLRDPTDMHVLQTAERGEADVLCTSDGDFCNDERVISYRLSRGIEICSEASLLSRLVRTPS